MRTEGAGTKTTTTHSYRICASAYITPILPVSSNQNISISPEDETNQQENMQTTPPSTPQTPPFPSL